MSVKSCSLYEPAQLILLDDGSRGENHVRDRRDYTYLQSQSFRSVWAKTIRIFEACPRRGYAPRNSHDWTFNWREFWQKADFDCEAIIKLFCQGKVLGLARLGLFPYPSDDAPEYLEILHIQCVSKSRRQVNPVGFWLLWYALKIGLQYCVGDADGTLIRLDSIEDAIPYYRDKVKMEKLGWTSLAPGEQGYAFRFTQERAQEFCSRVEQEYGCPVPLS